MDKESKNLEQESVIFIDNDGGGDCLLYTFLYPMYMCTNNLDYYHKNKLELADTLRKAMFITIKSWALSDQDASDVKDELGVYHTDIQAPLIPLIVGFTGMSVYLFTVHQYNENDVNFHPTYYDNPNGSNFIVIQLRNNHYKLLEINGQCVFSKNDKTYDYIKTSYITYNNKIKTVHEVNIPS